MDAWTAIAIMVPLSIGMITVARIFVNRNNNSAWFARNIKGDYDKLLKAKEEYIIELEDSVRHYKNAASNAQRGPKLEGKEDEWNQILPEIFGSFSNYAPKWLKPFLGNTEVQKALIQKVQENPEKYAEYFTKFIGKKNGQNNSQQESEEANLI